MTNLDQRITALEQSFANDNDEPTTIRVHFKDFSKNRPHENAYKGFVDFETGKNPSLTDSGVGHE